MSTNVTDKRADATVLSLNSRFTFGRYKKTDKTVADIVRDDPEYLVWANASVDFIIVPVEILAMCYDKNSVPGFKFSLVELHQNIQYLEDLFEGATIPPAVQYILGLMRYIHEQFVKTHEIKLKLDE